MLKVLVLCTGNSCRSILGEAVLNHYGRGRIQAYSAGSAPVGEVHPGSIATLRRHQLPSAGYRSKSWDEFRAQPIDLVITVCDSAAGEACPLFPGQPARAHWGLPDPAQASGTPEQVEAVFEAVYLKLERWAKALAALPLEALGGDELQRQAREVAQS